MVAPIEEELSDISNDLKREILNLVRQLEAGDALPDYVAGRTEEIIDALGVISALFDQDFEQRVIAILEEALQLVSGNIAPQQHTRGPGRLALDIPSVVLED
ncbi:hypothetical protein CHARACLAT_033448 [Characodon lateralis]|uniref:Uncharacterized protein n=1 Tax=Characodon lateralis TaxID=208331 RepID=A0ABU7DF69_9TELE|nr:hypothetical protein [Characodon lateralis]